MSTRELLQSILIDMLRIETLLLRNKLQGVEGSNTKVPCKAG